jgi:hypothetical protein
MTSIARSRRRRHGQAGFLRQHALSLSIATVLFALAALYRQADPSSHLGSFYGNAIADWLGTLLFVLATKYFYEIGSAESRRVPKASRPITQLLEEHSLTIVLALSGLAWVFVYRGMAVDGKWGQVVGNIVSEWTQVLGLVLITKFARESRSKES